jgi:CHAD domain-containing protein
MSYRLKSHEKLSRGIRRVAERQAEGIRQCLERNARSAEAVHAARTHIKKLRALARLVRKPLGGKLYADCNGILKAVAKSLSPLRDAEVRLRTLERLRKTHPDQLAGQPELQTLLAGAQQAKRHANVRSAKWRQQEVRRLLEKIETWPLNGIRKKALNRGIARSRRRVREGFKEARQTPTIENLHAWRKASKDLMHQMAMVERLGRIDGGQKAVLKKLGQLLGDDHDLAMLEAKAGELRRPIMKPIRKLIHKKRMALQKAAFALGRRLKNT